MRPHPIPAQEAVLVLGESGDGHEEDVFFGPTGFGGEGEHLGC
jgi:hypothetical protein